MSDVCFTGAGIAIMAGLLGSLAAAISLLYNDARSTLAHERARTAALQALIEEQLRISARTVHVQGQLAEGVGGLARGVSELRQGAR